MSIAYRPRRKKRPWPLILALAAVAGLVAIGGEIWWMKSNERAEAKRPVGPPCPTLTVEAFATRYGKIKLADTYEDMGFGRAAGHMSCDLMGGERVCQFTGPIVVAVTPPGRPATYFEPGVGQPATVTVGEGAPTCVMASNFRI